MKYLYIAVAMMFVGCSVKSPVVQKLPVTKQKVEVVEVAKVGEVKKEVKKKAAKKIVLNKNETLVEERKVTKNIPSDVPASCAMWSDGNNVCTRVSASKASCTTNPIVNRMFSCLQWQ